MPLSSLISHLTQNVQGYLMDTVTTTRNGAAVAGLASPRLGRGRPFSGGEGQQLLREEGACRDVEEAWGWGQLQGAPPPPPAVSAVSWEPTPNTPDTCIGCPTGQEGTRRGRGAPSALPTCHSRWQHPGCPPRPRPPAP